MWVIESYAGGIRISDVGAELNWSSGCQSHYVMSNNQIHWAGAFSAGQIAANRASDRVARERAQAERTLSEAGFWRRLWIKLKSLWVGLMGSIVGGLRVPHGRSRGSSRDVGK
jgi:hypothetical protein